MKVKTVKRKWARAYWLFLWGALLSGFLTVILPERVKPLCLLSLVLCGVGMVVSEEKLRCPYCGKGRPRPPAFSPSSGRVSYCSGCGRPFVYDDEVDAPDT